MSSLTPSQQVARRNASSFSNPINAMALAILEIKGKINSTPVVIKKIKPTKREPMLIVAKKAEPPKVVQHKKGQPVWNKHVESILKLSEGVFIFEMRKAEILKLGKFQLVHTTTGAASAKKDAADSCQKKVLKSVRVDMVKFDEHCTISGMSINPIPNSGLCRVFVNFRSAIDDPGEHWGKGTIYEKLLDITLFAENWGKVKIKYDGDDDVDRTNIVLQDPDENCRSKAENLLTFCGYELL